MNVWNDELIEKKKKAPGKKEYSVAIVAIFVCGRSGNDSLAGRDLVAGANSVAALAIHRA